MKTKRIIISSVTFLFCLLILICNENVAAACLSALSVSAEKVIPSLFPYMVLSSVIISLRLADPLCRFVPMHLFSLPDCSAPVLLTGILCGYPAGASGSAALFRSGEISKDEASRLCALSGHVSPAFLIGTVGSLWGSKTFGWYLFTCGIVYTCICGFVSGRKYKSSQHFSQPEIICDKRDAVTVFCQAVTSSAASCLNVTGFIVFFRAAGAAVSSVIPSAEPFASVLFEFSSGTVYASSVSGISGAALTGFAVGFSGFSVLAQTAACISPHDIPVKPYIISKLAEGIFMASAAAVYCVFFPIHPVSDAFSPSPDSFSPMLIALPAVLAAVRYAGEIFRFGNKFRVRS